MASPNEQVAPLTYFGAITAFLIAQRDPQPSPQMSRHKMAPEQEDHPPQRDVGRVPQIPDPPRIHPSFIEVARPYVFEETIQGCIAAMGGNHTREESLRLQGVAWIENVRTALHLYVLHADRNMKSDLRLIKCIVLCAHTIQLRCITTVFASCTTIMSTIGLYVLLSQSPL